MQNDKVVVGLDIGTTKVCAIAGRLNEYGKLDILGLGMAESLGVTKGMVANINKTVEAIKEAVQKASDKSDVNIGVVHVGIAGQHIRSLQHSTAIVRKNVDNVITQEDLDKLQADIQQLVVEPGTEIIHTLPQDYIIDGHINTKEPIGMHGVKLECNYHVITGHTTAATNIYKCVKQSGLDVADLILEPIASSESVLAPEEMEAGVALVDIGGGTTDIAIFHDSVIRHTAVIPFGGNVITDDIKEGCRVIREHAEKMKVMYGSAMPMETRRNEIISIPGFRGRDPREISVHNLSKIIHARMEEILEMVYLEIKNSGLEKKLAAGLVITGGGALLKDIRHLAEYVTGLETRIGYPNEHLAKGFVEEVKSPAFATAVGLVLKGFASTGKMIKETEKQETDERVEKRKAGMQKESLNFLGKIKSGFGEWLAGDQLKDF